MKIAKKQVLCHLIVLFTFMIILNMNFLCKSDTISQLSQKPQTEFALSENEYCVGNRDDPDNSTFQLQTPWIGVTIDEMIHYRGFETDGHAISVYGEFLLDRSDLELEFNFVDQIGLDEVLTGGLTTRTYLHDNYYSNHTWNEILPIEFLGSTVSTWYVILSVGAYPASEDDRIGWLYCGLDITPPNATIILDDIIEGGVAMPVSLNECNCELASVTVKIGGEQVHNDPNLSGQELTFSVPWDSTDYPNGLCQVLVNVSDIGGNHIVRTYFCTIQNQHIPAPLPPSQVNITEIWNYFYEGITNPFFVLGLFFVFGTTTLKLRKASLGELPIWIWASWLIVIPALIFSGLWLFAAFLFQMFTFAATFMIEANDHISSQKKAKDEKIKQVELDILREESAEKDRKLEELEKRLEKVEQKQDDQINDEQ